MISLVKMLYERVCPHCGVRFNTDNPRKIYCNSNHMNYASHLRIYQRDRNTEKYHKRLEYINAKMKIRRQRLDVCNRCGGPNDNQPLKLCTKCRIALEG